jgi:hypothetical protein
MQGAAPNAREARPACVKHFRITKHGAKGRKLRTRTGLEISHEEFLRALIRHFVIANARFDREKFVVCSDCSSLVEVGPRGQVPKRCSACREAAAMRFWRYGKQGARR